MNSKPSRRTPERCAEYTWFKVINVGKYYSVFYRYIVVIKCSWDLVYHGLVYKNMYLQKELLETNRKIFTHMMDEYF